MRKADESLVRAHITASTRALAQAVCRRTGERRWALFLRLVRAEYERLQLQTQETRDADD